MPTPSADIEERMQLAVQAVWDGKYTTFKEAAAKFYVPYNLTLQWSHGRATNHSCGDNNKKFSKEEDQALIVTDHSYSSPIAITVAR